MTVLGIETSCDETSASVVSDDGRVLSSIVRTQTSLHRPYGGVVPEIASRAHLETLPTAISEALGAAGTAWGDIDTVAVTYGPGLASSLLVGFSTAKGLASALGKPLCAINHLQAHIFSPFLSPGAPSFTDTCPFVALVVSGGHTCLVRVEGLGRYRLLGETIDDAAGEAFDKGANLLGLGYPGGPAMDRLSRSGNPAFVDFPQTRVKPQSPPEGCDPALCFSYSGLKTSLLYYLRRNPIEEGSPDKASIAASYQEAIVDSLVDRCRRAMRGVGALAVGGGVSLNSRLRTKLAALAEEMSFRLLMAEPKYCADNAAMIAGLAAAGQGIRGAAVYGLDIEPSLAVTD